MSYGQSVFRPSSCPPTSPPVVAERAKLKPHSSLGWPSLTPATSPSPVPLIQDGSYLETLGLRLNEAVCKALVSPSGSSLPSELLGGKRPIPAGRGRTLGALIACELKAACDNSNLRKAILRALRKPLSVLVSNLSALLLPLLSTPTFIRPSAPTLNAAQLHALAIADFAGELLASFDDLALGVDTDGRGDGLKPIRAGLISLINRVVTPMIAGIKEELIPVIDALETPAQGSPHNLKLKGPVHPSVIALQSSVPIYGRTLARFTNTSPSHTLLASFLISIVWRALVALSHRPIMSRSSDQVLAEKGPYRPSPRSPPVTPPTGLFGLKRASSRPASPVMSTSGADAKALYEIFSHFPRPTLTQVAREAVDEAYVHLESLASLLEIVDDPLIEIKKTAEVLSDQIHNLTDDLPTLITLPVILRIPCFGRAFNPHSRSVAALLNVSEDVYRKDCLTGFGRAEECGPVVAQRILDEIYTRPDVDSSEYLAGWLETRIDETDH